MLSGTGVEDQFSYGTRSPERTPSPPPARSGVTVEGAAFSPGSVTHSPLPLSRLAPPNTGCLA